MQTLASKFCSVDFHTTAQFVSLWGTWLKCDVFPNRRKQNPKIESISFDNCSVRKASFFADGPGVIASGTRKLFFVLDAVKV